MTFAENFKRVIAEKDFTVEKLAKKVGRTPQTVYSALRKGSLSLSLLNTYAQAVGIPAYRLLMTPEDEAMAARQAFRCPKCGQTFVLVPLS